MSSNSKTSPTIQPVILCGGSGSRLWPLSRQALPKQFLRLTSEFSMLQETVLSLSDDKNFHPPVLVSNETFQFMIQSQMQELDIEPSALILEPESRNTAAAIALAALKLDVHDPNACLLVLPSDHVLGDKDKFLDAIHRGYAAAEDGALVTFAMKADRPETGYGYIRQGKAVAVADGCYKVDRFVEKPDAKTAERFLDEGGYYWNSGMFMFQANRFLEELYRHQPEIFTAAMESLGRGTNEGGIVRPDPQTFATIESISIDYAVMEHTKHAVMVAADFGWSDVGSWASIADLASGGDDGNTTEGDAVLHDCEGTFIRGGRRLIAAIGLRDQIIIDTEDALLIVPKDRAQDVKAIVEKLKETSRPETALPAVVQRPWGTYEGIQQGARHQVKHIVVKPGEKLSLQYHHHRSEHWTVVAGAAEVTIDGMVRMLKADESVYIPVGATHRLYNPGREPMHLIEVQCGDYLGEDDIVRLEDVYGRTTDTVEAAE
ncbi:MAG: mannose-1-phosphate guanylyltransferase/mannose-6-phosphate isomerase [Rhodospirillales bacterium]|nr:mannose-1-phosphate guanylyltransferase/mannose-6-phosphate isomerase [Rhodospirillales bacterium]